MNGHFPSFPKQAPEPSLLRRDWLRLATAAGVGPALGHLAQSSEGAKPSIPQGLGFGSPRSNSWRIQAYFHHGTGDSILRIDAHGCQACPGHLRS